MPCGAQKNFGAMADGESDTFKRVLIEGNPYFLALTFSVSLLHSLFDMLAFKNDIGFWRGKKNVEGLSVRTILLNCFCQVRFCQLEFCQGSVQSQLCQGLCLWVFRVSRCWNMSAHVHHAAQLLLPSARSLPAGVLPGQFLPVHGCRV